MFALRTAGPKGLGLFATRPIAIGTRILSEKPLLSILPYQSRNQLFRNAEALSKDERSVLLGLSFFEGAGVWGRGGRVGSTVLWTLRDVMSGGEGKDGKIGGGEGGKGLFKRLRENGRILDIWRSNSFALSTGPSSNSDSTLTSISNTKTNTTPNAHKEPTPNNQTSLFPTIARLNHACIPNTQANFHPGTQTFNIHATRNIAADEELLLSYLAENGDVRAERQGRLQRGYGFVCQCSACDFQGIGEEKARRGEKKREVMKARLRDFAAGERGVEMGVGGGYSPDGEAWGGYEECVGAGEVGSGGKGEGFVDGETDLQITTDLIRMLEEEGVSGREVATMYYSVARILREEDNQEKALLMAERGLEIDRNALGADHPLCGEAEAFVETLRL